MKKYYNTWTTEGSPDFIQSYRFRGSDVGGKKNVTNYSTRDCHNIQVIFNKGLDGNLRIGTAYPDIDVDLGSAIPLDQVRQYYESLMNNGSASDSVSRNQVYQNALTEFKKALLWANDNNNGSLTNLTKRIIEQYKSIAGKSKDPKVLKSKDRNAKLPELNEDMSLITIFTKLEQVIY